MKRWTSIIAATAIMGSALAQGPFTIIRPVDGAKVRETVRVQVPKNTALDNNAYVGVFLNGKFIEATVLEKKGDFYEYLLDTKARKIPDGKLKLELVLYSSGDKPRVTDRTAVDIEVANVASIPIPDEGLKLHYKFRAGNKYTYTINDRSAIVTISEAQARLGGRAAELPLESSTLRMLYAVDNAYSNGEGLIRMVALPEKGKKSAFIKTQSTPEGRKFMDYEMHPVYMRVSNKGREVFSNIPIFAGVEGSVGESSRTDLYAVFPLPTLPAKNVKPGDPILGKWAGTYQNGAIDLEKLYETKTLVQKIDCRGELLGVEWEMGHPCAKIRNTLELSIGGRQSTAGRDGGVGLGNNGIKLEETIWFAMDIGVPVKIVRDEQQDIRIQAPSGGGAGGGGNAGNGGRGPGLGTSGGGRQGGPGVGTGGGGATGASDKTMLPPMSNSDFLAGTNMFRQGNSLGDEGGPPGGRQGGRQGGNTGGNTGGGGGGGTQYIRIRAQRIFTLEQ